MGTETPTSWRDRKISLTRQHLIAAAAAAAVLLGGTGSLCGYYAIQKSSTADKVAAADSRKTDEDAASKAASSFLTTMFTVNDGSLERWDNAVIATTTDSMHQQLGQWRTVLERLVKAHVEMSSQVTDIGVVSRNGDAVTLLAVIESTGRTDPDAAQPSVSSSAALVEMRRVDDRWKVEGYGPAGGIPPATEPAPQTPPAETPAPEQTPR